MLSYRFKCWKDSIKVKQKAYIQKVSKTSNEKIMLLSKCAVFNSKKTRFTKE